MPKTIQLDKRFVAASAERTLKYFDLRENDRVLLCLPMRYIAGKLMVVRALLGRLDLWTLPPTSDFACLRDTERPFRFVAMVANQVAKLLAHPERFSAIETLLIGGSALPKHLEEALQNVPSRCFVSYGMTETATHVALRAVNGVGQGDDYHCLEGVRVDLKDGRLVISLPSGEVFITNDMAQLRDERTFRILGRADNVIISGGIKFIPEAIEAKLSPYISYPFFITSQADAQLGQQLVMAIEAEESATLQSELESIFKQQLSRYERPKAVYYQRCFQRTETDKIIRVL